MLLLLAEGKITVFFLGSLPFLFQGRGFMLVLSRHRDESIMIGDDVIITIVDIRGDKVRIGIEAPNDVPVHRKEVYEAIKREERKKNPPQPSA
jgi:carbon storage regulator